MKIKKESVTFWVPIIAVIVTVAVFGLTITERVRISSAIYARNPDVDYLEAFIQEAGESFWVVVPIINKSTSASAIGHRVQVSITFGIDNLIKRINADPFVVKSGWEDGHSANLELSVLYPGTVIYTSFLVEKPQLPEQIAIGWAEKTGIQTIPLR